MTEALPSRNLCIDNFLESFWRKLFEDVLQQQIGKKQKVIRIDQAKLSGQRKKPKMNGMP